MKSNGNGNYGKHKPDDDDMSSELLDDVKKKGEALLKEGLQTARDAFKERAQDWKKKAGEYGDKSMDEISDELQHYVRKNPLRSLGYAVGLGVLIGFIIKD